MFGRYSLPLWREIVGLLLVVIFVWSSTLLANQFIWASFGIAPASDCSCSGCLARAR